MTLYMAVTPDKYEFPVFIEDSCIALECKQESVIRIYQLIFEINKMERD